MAINIMAAPAQIGDIKPRITVVGVGGAGGNAVSNMIASDLQGVDFVVANTDAQALAQSRATRRIQLGSVTTQGLGAGSRPEIGRNAAEEAIEEIIAELAGSNMVFITAGMGGGTGTGAAPVIARAAKEQGILTVGVVTKPFHFEGQHRMRLAETGISAMQQYVDTLIIIPNQNLFRIATERTTFADAFKMADDVLHSGVRGITDLMMMPGLINLDFADIRTVMTEMGKAHMGTGEASGEKRALDAAEAAISNPLLEDTSMKGAKGVLINITGGSDLTLFEVDEAANRVRDEVDPEANIIFGSTFDDSLSGKIRVSVVATGIESEVVAKPKPNVYNIIAEREKREEIRQPEPAPAPVQVSPEPVRMVQQAQAVPQPAYAAPAYAEPEEMVMPPRPAPQMFAAEAPASSPSFELTPTEAVSRPQKSLFARMTGAVAGTAKERVAPSVSVSPAPNMQATAPRLQMPPQPQVTAAPQAAPVRPNPAPVVKKVVENPQPTMPPQPRLGFNTVDAKATSLPKGEDDLLDIPAFLRRQAN